MDGSLHCSKSRRGDLAIEHSQLTPNPQVLMSEAVLYPLSFRTVLVILWDVV